MFGLQELFDKQIEELFRPGNLGVSILENELKEIGLSITTEQRTEFEAQFSNPNSDILTFDFSDAQLDKAGISSEEDLKPKLKEVVEGLSAKIDKFENEIDETMESMVEGVTDIMAHSFLEALDEQMGKVLEDQSAITQEIAENVFSVWGEPLGLLQGLIVVADECAEAYVTRCDDYAADDLVHEVLIRIHAKAVQVSKEILTLLMNGYPGGAQARWRTLHELSVVSAFISEHGQEIAERYIDHEAVEIYKAAIQYNDYYTRLGAIEIPQEEMDAMRKDYLEVLDLYGTNYKGEYGWAARALNSKKPTFRDIEVSVDLDHHRPYYKSASANVHANPVGVFNNFGLLSDENIILSGPCNVGFAEPAQSTIISLNIITTTMLAHGANLDCIVIGKVVNEFGYKVEDSFIKVESEILHATNE